jgi:quinol monooxygenase YgiN
VQEKTTAYAVAATYQCRPGQGAHVADLLRQMTVPSRSEAGCLHYQAHQAVDDPDLLYLYEQYVDETAYEAHRASPHFKTLIEDRAIPLLVSRERAFFRTL